jgi:hypothetical protein
VLAATLLVVAASWLVTRRDTDALMSSSSSDSTLNVLRGGGRGVCGAGAAGGMAEQPQWQRTRDERRGRQACGCAAPSTCVRQPSCRH